MKNLKMAKATVFNIQKAASILRRGGVVAFPTETVYGLGADAFNEKAVCRIFEVKKRPSFDPLIVHVADARQAILLWKRTPKIARTLMEKFWPGPLSLVLPKNKRVPDIVTSGLPTVAVRVPDHPVALKLIREAGCPLAAPSANLFGYTSPTSALSAAQDLGDKIDFVLDGGPSRVGVESTVVKIENGRVILLRPGGVTVDEIEKAVHGKVIKISKTSKYESPGQLKSHYAPRVPLVLMGENPDIFMKKLFFLKKEWRLRNRRWPKIACLSFSGKNPKGLFSAEVVLSPKKDLEEAASKLFQAVRKLDKMDPLVIVATPFPEQGIGLAIQDRLDKASGGKYGWDQCLLLLRRTK